MQIEDARNLVSNNCIGVCEVANMPTDIENINLLQEHNLIFILGKAANAGGVAVSGLEMAQNSMRIQWTAEKVNRKLLEIMQNIHAECIEHGIKMITLITSTAPTLPVSKRWLTQCVLMASSNLRNSAV